MACGAKRFCLNIMYRLAEEQLLILQMAMKEAAEEEEGGEGGGGVQWGEYWAASSALPQCAAARRAMIAHLCNASHRTIMCVCVQGCKVVMRPRGNLGVATLQQRLCSLHLCILLLGFFFVTFLHRM